MLFLSTREYILRDRGVSTFVTDCFRELQSSASYFTISTVLVPNRIETRTKQKTNKTGITLPAYLFLLKSSDKNFNNVNAVILKRP